LISEITFLGSTINLFLFFALFSISGFYQISNKPLTHCGKIAGTEIQFMNSMNLRTIKNFGKYLI